MTDSSLEGVIRTRNMQAINLLIIRKRPLPFNRQAALQRIDSADSSHVPIIWAIWQEDDGILNQEAIIVTDRNDAAVAFQLISSARVEFWESYLVTQNMVARALQVIHSQPDEDLGGDGDGA